LDQGQLDLDGVDRTTEQVRSLYERLVVLRHKAREVRVVPPTPPVAEPSPPHHLLKCRRCGWTPALRR
jgi:hypothetical protein